MKKRKIWNIVFLIAFALTLLTEALAAIAVLRLNMLPGALAGLLIAAFVVYDLLLAYFMFLRGRRVRRETVGKVIKRRRIIASVLAVVMICGCTVVATVANDVRNTFSAVQASEQASAEKTITRAVFVRTYDSAQSLTDAKNYTFGIVEGYDDECTRQAIAAIEAQLGTTIQTERSLSAYEMADGLLSGRLDAMILNSAYVSVLEDNEQYEMFSDSTRILADVEIEGTGEELDGSDLLLNSEGVVAENGVLKPFIMYVSGSDAREGALAGNSRSDVNILAVVNPETNQVLLLNTPRDTLVANPHGDNMPDKLTHCGIWGIANSIGALENLYGCQVQYYAQINFSGFARLITALDGITVHSDVAFTLHNNVGEIKVGENHLNGRQALAFARTRKAFDDGDNTRGKNQMKVIKAILEKATSGKTVLTRYKKIMKSIDGMFVMNVPMPLISEVVKRQLADMPEWNIQTYAISGEGDSEVLYSSQGMKQYIIRPDEKTVAKAQSLIQAVLNGEVLTDELMKSE